MSRFYINNGSYTINYYSTSSTSTSTSWSGTGYFSSHNSYVKRKNSDMLHRLRKDREVDEINKLKEALT